MERIINRNSLSLVKLVKLGQDERATRIICQTANKLHNSQEKERPPLVSLTDWFASLLNKTKFSDKALKESALVASRLLSNQIERCVLHGDLHHQNILYSDLNGWLAIDPKALYGDRAFDFANILYNPNKDVALDKDRLVRQIEVISDETNIDFDRMLDWVIAWGGLSAIWMQEDKQDARLPIQLVKNALALKKERMPT